VTVLREILETASFSPEQGQPWRYLRWRQGRRWQLRARRTSFQIQSRLA